MRCADGGWVPQSSRAPADSLSNPFPSKLARKYSSPTAVSQRSEPRPDAERDYFAQRKRAFGPGRIIAAGAANDISRRRQEFLGRCADLISVDRGSRERAQTLARKHPS